MPVPPKRFAIAGGGIAGFAAAIALARAGLASTIFERRAELPDDGAGIQIGPNGTRILNDLGVAPYLRDFVGVPDALSVRDGATGRELARLPLGPWIEARHGSPYWTAHRADLYRALRARAAAEPSIDVRLGSAVRSFEELNDGVAVATEHDDAAPFAALLAADGLWSNCRNAIVEPAPAPEPVGKAAYRAVIPAERYPGSLASTDTHIWLLPGAHAVHYPVRAGAEFAVVIIANDREAVSGWSAPASPETIAKAGAGFAAPLRSLVAGAGTWRKWSLHTLSPLRSWTRGRATLVGDAAHPMLPFLAQGAVMALEDATTLAQCCKVNEADTAAALARYEAERRDRVGRVVEASRRNGQIYQQGGIAAAARNSVLKLTPGRKLMAQLDWLYGAKL